MLNDKVIVITGVGPGMGSKMALAAPETGARTVLVARRAELLDQLIHEIRSAGGQAIAVAGDVTRPGDCAQVVEQALAAYGRIDGLINSAYSAGKMASVEEADLDSWRGAMEVTLFGTINMIRAVLPTMKAAGGGAIVNVGTMETRKPLPQNGAYNVPKAALHGLTRQLATELGQYRIRVNTAVPGWMWGKPVEDFFATHSAETGVPVQTLVEQTQTQIALGRIPPDDECAKAVLVLLSDACSQVTGAALEINGGQFFSL